MVARAPHSRWFFQLGPFCHILRSVTGLYPGSGLFLQSNLLDHDTHDYQLSTASKLLDLNYTGLCTGLELLAGRHRPASSFARWARVYNSVPNIWVCGFLTTHMYFGIKLLTNLNIAYIRSMLGYSTHTVHTAGNLAITLIEVGWLDWFNAVGGLTDANPSAILKWVKMISKSIVCYPTIGRSQNRQ